MAMFVHLAPEKVAKAILRGGIHAQPVGGERGKGVFAAPVVPNFHVSHQWLRELKRGGQRTICGVYFRIPDDERVYVGHYNSEPLDVTAAEAIAAVMNAESPEGFQIFVPRKIQRGEIHEIRSLPQVVGWRYYPEAKGARPCGCRFCQRRGEIKSRRIKEAWRLEFE